MLRSAAIVFGTNGVGFALSAAFETHKLTDLVGVGSFVVVAADMFVKAKRSNNIRAMLLDVGVMAWGTRLASFLFYRVLQVGHDDRLRKFFREPDEPWLDQSKSLFPLKLGFFWTIQAIWPLLCIIPLNLLHASPVGKFDLLTKACTGLGAVAIVIEAVADWQKYKYRSDPRNAGHWCDTGLWSLSRHPNYFAEMLFWSSMWGSCVTALPPVQRVTSLCAPAFVYLLLMHVSGVPLLEEKHEKQYGESAEFKKYKSNTNLLLPLPKF